MRFVLDTNVLVSIYLYDDARHTPLRTGYQSAAGPDALLMDAVCYEELAHVLRSRRFAEVRATREIDPEALLIAIADDAMWIESAIPPNMPALPQCRDPDDQKFLALAARGNADAIYTYDKALLKCRHRTTFAITHPPKNA